MAPAYRSLEDGQIVTSDTPREDLEGVARWEKISDAEAAAAIAAQPDAPVDEDTERLLAYLAEHEISAAHVVDLLTRLEAGDPADESDTRGDESAPSTPAVEAPAGNASTEKWAEYAQKLGVTVPADATREAIKTAIDDTKTAAAVQQ